MAELTQDAREALLAALTADSAAPVETARELVRQYMLAITEDRRARLVAAESDLLDIRGALSPDGCPRRVPMALGPRVAPAVEWLLDRVTQLEREQEEAAELAEDLRRQIADLADQLAGAHRSCEEQQDALADARPARRETAQQAVCPVCQRPGCCCRCFGKSPRRDCPHQTDNARREVRS